ncbi:MAG: acetyl-CoA carboxylase, carboxyltransferase subunit beta [Coriobacteriales bacterium]|jgi:acetyl-CoA carboxylase carboxyl transferase beta subunit/acetyl-CoA carboxylase carboxyl transferase alpha subunit
MANPTNPFAGRREFLQAIKQLKPRVVQEAERKAKIESLNSTCPDCGRVCTPAELEDNLSLCPDCGHHFRMIARDRLYMLLDDGKAASYRELDSNLVGDNPLKFPGYAKKLEASRATTHLSEALRCAVGTIGGCKCVLVVLDSYFMMGSMGVAVGERVTRAIEYATEQRLPLIIFSASGGARMQEGIMSLMQMAKTSAAIARHDEAGLLYISVLTNPTTGGVTASFASLGDIILAEPGALIGFAGPRVIEQTIKQQLPEGFQRSEYLLEHGFIDSIVPRRELREKLQALLRQHVRKPIAEPVSEEDTAEGAEDAAPGGMGAAWHEQDAEVAAVMQEASSQAQAKKAHPLRDLLTQVATPAHKRVELARSPERPNADYLIEALFSNFTEMHGDRLDADDQSIKGGVAYFRDVPVTVIAQCKGKTLEDNLRYNFGMPNPQGYRKAQRLARQAEKFGRPVITIIDTPGAYPGIEAEEKGQGEAIARSIELFSTLKVPVIALIIGEGGSGGALALGVANSVIMLENAIYSILSPEGFAAILWKDASRAKEAASVMKLTAADIASFGVADMVIPEGDEPLSIPAPELVARIDAAIADELLRLAPLDGTELANMRYEKFRAMGNCIELKSEEN